MQCKQPRRGDLGDCVQTRSQLSERRNSCVEVCEVSLMCDFDRRKGLAA